MSNCAAVMFNHLRYECSYDRMAEEICSYIDWDPMLVMTVPFVIRAGLAALHPEGTNAESFGIGQQLILTDPAAVLGCSAALYSTDRTLWH